MLIPDGVNDGTLADDRFDLSSYMTAPLTNYDSSYTDAGESCQPDKQSSPPCKTVSGRVVPVGIIGYRPLDVILDDKMEHGVYGAHHNMFVANQNPKNCMCFWQKQKYVFKPEQLTSAMVPVEAFIN